MCHIFHQFGTVIYIIMLEAKVNTTFARYEMGARYDIGDVSGLTDDAYL